MKPARYIFVNKGLGMSPGKIAAQVAHAEMRANVDFFTTKRRETQADMFAQWLRTGHTKLIMEARDSGHLQVIERFLNDKGYATFLVIDEGRTEIAPHSPTALAVELVDREDEQVQHDFGDFRTLRYSKKKKKWFAR